MNMRRILSGALGNERKASHTKQQRKKWKKKEKNVPSEWIGFKTTVIFIM